MAKCEFCGKKTVFGVSVSHSRSHVSGRHNRVIRPNLQRVTLPDGNQYRQVTVCTRCLRTLRKANRPRQ